jgi:hypothetical protein
MYFSAIVPSNTVVAHVYGVRIRLWTAATNGPIIDTLDDIWIWKATVEWYWQGKTKELGVKPVPVQLCPTQIPQELTWGIHPKVCPRGFPFLTFISMSHFAYSRHGSTLSWLLLDSVQPLIWCVPRLPSLKVKRPEVNIWSCTYLDYPMRRYGYEKLYVCLCYVSQT